MKAIVILITTLFLHLPHQVNAEEKPLSVGILLYPGVQIIDFTGPYEIFGWANYRVSTVSQDGKPIVTTMNLTVTPSYSFAKAPRFDILLIPGGDYSSAINQPTLDWVRAHSQSASRVVSVCTGAFILAEAGLLNGLTATSFYPAIDTLKAQYPKINIVSNKRFVDNGKFITSAGLSAGVDVALHLVAQHQGLEKAQSIATEIEYGWNPDSGYVRGNMADSQLASIKKSLLDIIGSEPIYAYGSESEWLESYSLTRTANKDMAAIKNKITSAIARTNDWLPEKGNWVSSSKGGSQWLLALNYSEKPQQPIQLQLHLSQQH